MNQKSDIKFPGAAKGTYGYIKAKRRAQLFLTILLLAAVLILYFGGRRYYGSNRNIFTIMAALACLPTGWSCVNLIMLLRAGMCSEDAHRQIEAVPGLTSAYDLYLTSYQKNFQLSHIAVRAKNIAALSEDPKIDTAAGEEHIRSMIRNDGFEGYTIKIFTSPERYAERLLQLARLEAGNPEREEKLKSLFLAISL